MAHKAINKNVDIKLSSIKPKGLNRIAKSD